MEVVSSYIKNGGFSEDFSGHWMLVAEWKNVPMYPGDRPDIVSITCTYYCGHDKSDLTGL